jgi:hypothetical protein
VLTLTTNRDAQVTQNVDTSCRLANRILCSKAAARLLDLVLVAHTGENRKGGQEGRLNENQVVVIEDIRSFVRNLGIAAKQS